jgi:hypothetical protein
VEAAEIVPAARIHQVVLAIAFADRLMPAVENNSKPRDHKTAARRNGHPVTVPGGVDRARDTGACAVRGRTSWFVASPKNLRASVRQLRSVIEHGPSVRLCIDAPIAAKAADTLEIGTLFSKRKVPAITVRSLRQAWSSCETGPALIRFGLLTARRGAGVMARDHGQSGGRNRGTIGVPRRTSAGCNTERLWGYLAKLGTRERLAP